MLYLGAPNYLLLLYSLHAHLQVFLGNFKEYYKGLKTEYVLFKCTGVNKYRVLPRGDMLVLQRYTSSLC
jgi:hypothetical protein